MMMTSVPTRSPVWRPTPGYDVAVANDGRAALELNESFVPDAVVTDLHMPGMHGADLLRALKKREPALPVIVITAFAEIPSAIESMKDGAFDYVAKPMDWTTLSASLSRALRRRALFPDAAAQRAQLRSRMGVGLGGMIGGSDAMQSIYEQARRAAPSRATVLITGESGTGKGELARVLHDLSPSTRGSVRVSALRGTDT